MIFRFKTRNVQKRAFSLIEVSAAVAILALISSSVMVVVSRSVASGANSMRRMQAFEVARENMEKLLASDSVEETADYGRSERYPGIEWETVVETFYEPITARMWIRGVCTARFEDDQDQEQTVELTHWLTDVTKDQLLQIMAQGQNEEQELAAELIETVEEASLYASVDGETIEQWIDNGMLTIEDGSFVKSNLDLYMQTNGNPSPNQKQTQISSRAQLAARRSQVPDGKAADVEAGQGEIDPQTGLTYEELEQMDFSEVYDLMKNRRQ